MVSCCWFLYYWASSDYPFVYPVASVPNTVHLLTCHSLLFLLVIDASHKFSHLYFLTTRFLVTSFLTHPPQIPLYFNYTNFYEIPQISFASYLSLYIMFILPDNFLAIFIIADRYHSRLGIYQFLWTALLPYLLRGRTQPQPVIVPSWMWIPQMWWLHFSSL